MQLPEADIPGRQWCGRRGKGRDMSEARIFRREAMRLEPAMTPTGTTAIARLVHALCPVDRAARQGTTEP